MKKAILRKITEKVTEILKKAGALRPNQTVKVTISIVDVPQVTIEVAAKEDDAGYLIKIAEKMPLRRLRMRNVIELHGLTLSIIKSQSLKDMLIYRNLGKHTLREFRDALLAEGIHCQWMDELALEDLDELPIEQLGLSTRAENALRNSGIEKVGDFRHKTASKMLSLRNFGRRSVNEIHETMLKRGVNLGWVK
jgi:hypothetical protein